MKTVTSVLVVGASASGLSTVDALRRKGFTGSITVIGDEPHMPYDRPPLSKQILEGVWTPDRAQLRSDDMIAKLDAEFVLGEEAVALDVAERRVTSRSGREFVADAVVIATGVRPRELSGQAGVDGVFVMRSLEDSMNLRRRLLDQPKVVVVGEGVLGAEVSATARKMGAEVTMTGPQPRPMSLQIGTMASQVLADVHTENGVRLRLGVGVAELVHEANVVRGVRLATGEVLEAEAVVVSIGSVPATAWLADSGLTLDNGVVCNSNCAAAQSIYAVGDVSRWYHNSLGRHFRLENRTNATDQSAVVADDILGVEHHYEPIPYFWTDQFDVKIQVHGAISADATPQIVEGDISARRFVATYRTDGRVTGVLGWNMPKQTRLHRQDIVDDLEPQFA
ncbi:NAD(P)/FAD-dependent oxidoreductase [Gordonia insulae]|uniref:Rhodocoxin reductase n=1 Tax=Gordonia insulae TaxID=2420509 RepID=A0A3G8JND0_9ACTN|nr:FAD-dependent oxidoreductase [Gordonia insulae]AZG45959.1 Rhodocoxin reductase [Gordonia insulae]